MRPMWYEFPHDVNTFDLTNQFMYGSSILVAPKMGEQHRPQYFGGPTQVKVYLPKGETWFDYYTKLEVPVQDGQQTISVGDTAQGTLIRGGSILPLLNFEAQRESLL